MNTDVNAYLALFDAFREQRLHAVEFEAIFLYMFKNDPGGRDQVQYEALNDLFGHVDAYCDDPVVRQLASDGIGPEELRMAVDRARQKLAMAGGSSG